MAEEYEAREQEQQEQEVEAEVGQIADAAMGPMVEVVIRGEEERRPPFPFSDLSLEGDDPATIADDDVLRRCERWLDLAEGTLDGHKVNRPRTGHLLISPPAVFGMKAATIGALMRGDIENAIITETPGGIEAQEARGQRDFVASTTLPKECLRCSREQLEQMGIVFGVVAARDNLFIEAQLPEGWKKVPTDHSMWSRLLDDKGRERARIFYKAAFYDRKAHISLVRRFSYATEPVCGYSVPDYRKHKWHCIVRDGDKVIWQSTRQVDAEPEYHPDNKKERKAWSGWMERRDALDKLGKEWIAENYPDWRNPLAYWEEGYMRKRMSKRTYFVGAGFIGLIIGGISVLVAVVVAILHYFGVL